MSKLHLIGGEKGGVGKSFTTRLLAQYFIDTQQPFTGFDTDVSHSTFSRFYNEFTAPVVVDDYASLDKIIVAAEENPNSDIIIDLAAQSANKLNQWIEDSDLFGIMEELNFEAYLWHVMDDGADSVHLLGKLLEQFSAQKFQLVVVQNYGRGKNFRGFEKSDAYQLAKGRDAKFILLANLEEHLARTIDFNNFSFWAAANNREIMRTVERHRMKVWLKYSYEQIGKALGTASVIKGASPADSGSVDTSYP